MLLESFQFQFHSQFNTLKNLIQSDKIIDLRCLRASFGFLRLKTGTISVTAEPSVAERFSMLVRTPPK